MIEYSIDAAVKVSAEMNVATVKLHWETQPSLVDGDPERKVPVLLVSGNGSLLMPSRAPSGIIYGAVPPWKQPTNVFQIRQYKKNFAMIDTALEGYKGHEYMDEWPPTLMPIVVYFKDRKTPAEGFLCVEETINADGMINGNYVFMELLRDGDMTGAMPTVTIPCHMGEKALTPVPATFLPQSFKNVVGWNSLALDGTMIRPTAYRDDEKDIFISIKTQGLGPHIASMAAIDQYGYLAFATDSVVIDAVLASEPNSALVNSLDAPAGAAHSDLMGHLNGNHQRFVTWLASPQFFNEFRPKKLKLHVDTPNELAILGRLLSNPFFHSILKGINFSIELDNSGGTHGPVPLCKGYVEGSAAWEAYNLWRNFGYEAVKLARDFSSAIEKVKRQQIALNEDAKTTEGLAQALVKLDIPIERALKVLEYILRVMHLLPGDPKELVKCETQVWDDLTKVQEVPIANKAIQMVLRAVALQLLDRVTEEAVEVFLELSPVEKAQIKAIMKQRGIDATSLTPVTVKSLVVELRAEENGKKKSKTRPWDANIDPAHDFSIERLHTDAELAGMNIRQQGPAINIDDTMFPKMKSGILAYSRTFVTDHQPETKAMDTEHDPDKNQPTDN